jgi:hypothetical protein
MSRHWTDIAAAVITAGIVALAWAVPRARAAEHPPRQWAIERCHADQCAVLPARYSGPTACNLDAASERIGRAQPSGTRLVCIRAERRN